MENSSSKHSHCLKDVSNISRNKLVSAFPLQVGAVKNLAFNTNTPPFLKISASNPNMANQELDGENVDPRYVVQPLPGCKPQATISEISSIKMEVVSTSTSSTSSSKYDEETGTSDSSCDGFEIKEDLQLDEADKTQELDSGFEPCIVTASGGKENPSPDMSSLLHSRILFNVPDPIITDSLKDNGASPMFPIAPMPKQERRKLDFSNMDTTSPVSTSSENQQRKMLFRRSVSMVERGQRLQLNTTSPELSRHVGSAQDMTSPLSRPFASFKRPNVPLQPLSQNSLQGGSNQSPHDGTISQPCKKIRRGLSMKEVSRNDENQFLCKTSGLSNLMDSPQIAKPMLQLSLSETEANITRAISLTNVPNLTGDRSRALCLPTVKGTGKNAQTLDHMDCHTLADLLKGKYDHKVASFRIIDARYVYEFKGGHIRGAENFGAWDEEAFFNEFLPKTLPPATCPPTEEKAHIIIFHCEFSSERGPRLMANLRNRDRGLNKDNYPALHYPECYLLSQGYKEFFQNYPDLCEPKAYVKMLDPSYASEERKFHKKSKTWGGHGGTISRTNSSSRLLKL